MSAPQGISGGTILHPALLNRNNAGQHSSESAGVLSPYGINPNDIAKNFISFGVISVRPLEIANFGNGISFFGDINGHGWRSSDYGSTWSDLGFSGLGGVPILCTTSIGNGIGVMGDAGGNIWRSIDFGITWTFIANISGFPLNTFAHIGSDIGVGQNIVVVGDNNGHIFRSTNGGLAWVDLGDITSVNSPIISILYTDNGIVLAGDNVGHIRRSVDFGATWNDIIDLGFRTPGLSYLSNGVVIVAGGGGGNHVFRSTDFGLTWVDIVQLSIFLLSKSSYFGNGISIFTGTDGHVFRSTDYGLTWSDLGLLSPTTIGAISYLGNGVVILGDSNGNIYKSNTSFIVDEARATVHPDLLDRDLTGFNAHKSQSVGTLSPYAINPNDSGKSWSDLGAISPTILRGATYIGNGRAIIGDNNGHIWRTTDFGLSWSDEGIVTVVGTPSTSIFTSFYAGNGILFIGDSNRHLFWSNDYGKTWIFVSTRAAPIFCSAYLGNGIAIVGLDNGQIVRITGISLGFPGFAGFVVSGVAINTISYLDNGIIIIGDNNGHIWRSTTFGTFGSWVDLGAISVGAILGSVDLGNGVALVSNGTGHVFRSVDFGLNWVDLGVKSNGGSAIQTLQYLGNGIVIFGDFNGHVFKSTDVGLTWTDVGSGGAAISGTVIRTIAYLSNGVTVFGDNNGHIFRNELSFKIDEASATVHNDTVDRNAIGISAHNSELVGTLSPYSLNHNDVGGTVGATIGNWYITTATGVPIICTADINNGIVLAGGNNGHIFKSTDHGRTFFDFLTLSAFAINSIEYLGSGVVLAADNNATGHIFRSIDYGNSWTDEGAQSAFTITSIRYLGHGIVIFTDTGGFVNRSANFGQTWPLATGVGGSLNVSEYLDNGIVLVGDNAGKISRQTTFASGAFALVTSLGTGIRCIQYLSNGIVVAGDNNGHVLRSVDFGANWIDLGDITGAGQIVITMAYLGNGVAIAGVVAGVAGKIFKSTDYGLTWTDETPAGNVSGTFFNNFTAKYLGNGITLIADNAGNIFRSDVSYKIDEFIQDIDKPIRTIIGSETLEKDDDTLLVDATAGNITIFLPSITTVPGKVFNFKRVDATANLVTIDGAGAETIDTALTQPLNVFLMSLSMKAKPFVPNAGWWIF